MVIDKQSARWRVVGIVVLLLIPLFAMVSMMMFGCFWPLL
jgi:hypothetical protein